MTSAPLGLLEVSGLIRRSGGSAEQEYLFRHTLMQETVYASLLRQQRAELHEAVGRAMERVYSNGNARAALLADHFLKGGEKEKAARYFRQAGDQASRVYAIDEALQHFDQALELALEGYGEDDAILYLFERRGRMLELDARYERALAVYQEMEEVGHERDDPSLELRGMLRQGNLLSLPNPIMDLERGGEISRHALQLAKQSGDKEAQSIALWNLMKKSEFAEDYREALEAGNQALKLAEELELGSQRAFILNDLTAIYLSTGRFERAMETNREAQAMWRDLDNLPMLVDSLSSEMIMEVFRGNFDQALDLSEQAQELSERIGNLWGQSYSRYVVYWVHFERGEIGQGMQLARRCIELGQQAGFVVPMVQTQAEIGLIHAYMGQYEQALACVEKALASAEESFTSWRPPVLAAKMYCLQLAGQPEQVEKLHLEVMENRPSRPGDTVSYLEFMYSLVLPEIALAQGRPEQALGEADWYLEAFEPRGIHLSLGDSLYYGGRALLALERYEEGRERLRAACQQMRQIGSKRGLWRALAALAELEEKVGELEIAQQLRSEARQCIEYIAGNTESQAQRESFLAREEVRAALGGGRDEDEMMNGSRA